MPTRRWALVVILCPEALTLPVIIIATRVPVPFIDAVGTERIRFFAAFARVVLAAARSPGVAPLIIIVPSASGVHVESTAPILFPCVGAFLVQLFAVVLPHFTAVWVIAQVAVGTVALVVGLRDAAVS